MGTIIQSLFQPKRKSVVLSIVGNKTNLVVVLLLTAAVLLVYHSVFSHQFQMHWDDQWVVTNFYTENGLTARNLVEIFTEFFHGQYAPLNQLSYTLLYAAAGSDYNPVWFHTFSVILHTLNVVLTYFFIKNLLTQGGGFTKKSVQTIAFCTAFIMAVHPFLVEAVAWMAASKILIYSFFYLLALNTYLLYLRKRNIWYLVLIFFLFICSFGGKEQAVTLPVCLLLIDYILQGTLKKRGIWLEKIPFFLLALAFSYVTLLSQKENGVGLLTDIKKYPFYQNVIFGSYALTEYFVKCLIPVKLSFVYIFPNPIGTAVPLRFWIYPPLLIIIFVTLRDVMKNRWILFGVVFFIIHLAVTLHIIPISRFAIVADRYAYIASIGVFFLISYYFDIAIRSAKYRNAAFVLLTVYLTYLGGYTNKHAKVWHDSDTLKKEVLDEVKKHDELNNKLKTHGTN
jgi:hypothetical protein